MSSSFTKPLKYERAMTRKGPRVRNGRPLYVIIEPFQYDVGYEGSEISIHVEAGFETDFASVPRLADDWFGLNPSGRHNQAVVVHDVLYSCPALAQTVAEMVFAQKLAPLMAFGLDIGRFLHTPKARLAADLIMLEASEVLGVSFYTRHIHFLGVRLGGSGAFQRAQNQLAAQHN